METEWKHLCVQKKKKGGGREEDGGRLYNCSLMLAENYKML